MLKLIAKMSKYFTVFIIMLVISVCNYFDDAIKLISDYLIRFLDISAKSFLLCII